MTTERQKILDALTSLIETLSDSERTKLLAFLASNPTLRQIGAYVALGIERMDAGRRPIGPN